MINSSTLTPSYFYTLFPEFLTDEFSLETVESKIDLSYAIFGQLENNLYYQSLALAHLLTLFKTTLNQRNPLVSKVKADKEELAFAYSKDRLSAWLETTTYGSLLNYALLSSPTFLCF